jgi:arylsulfatase A-like enzyme
MALQGWKWRRSQVVRQRFAKPLFTGSNPVGASTGAGAIGVALGVGASASVWTALGDFGASWLWLFSAADRVRLLVQLLGTQVPLGALLAGCAAMCLLGARAISHRVGLTPTWHARWMAAAPVVVATAPLVQFSRLLFSGGKMSRIPHHDVWVVCTSMGLWLVAYVACGWINAWVTKVRERSAPVSWWFVLGCWAVHTVCMKLNQHVLPNLYDYLHGALSLAAWASAGVGMFAAWHRWTLQSMQPMQPMQDVTQPDHRQWFGRVTLVRNGVVAALMTAWLGVQLRYLQTNQNVWVAMLDPKAAVSRSLMLVLEPWLARTGPEHESLRRAIARAKKADASRTRPGSSALVVPNAHVLLITVDALRADHLGVYGYRRPTSPHIDELARQAVVFERAYTQAPHSSYSLASLHTSDYLHERVKLGQSLSTRTLASVLADEQYYTLAIFTSGVFHTEGAALRPYQQSAFGFARHDQSTYGAREQTDKVLAEVRRVTRHNEPSLLLWTHYFNVHEPYQDTHFGTSPVDRYDSEIRKVDEEISRLVAALRSQLRRPLIVVLTADHGEEFRDHGGIYHGSTLYEEQVRVPLLIWVPTASGTGHAARVRTPVALVDIAPTLLRLLGVDPPTTMRGKDLRPWLDGSAKSDDMTGAVFSAVAQKRMALRWPYKLISDLRFNTHELYDLSVDDREKHNLAGTRARDVQSMQGELYQWLDSFHARAQPDSVQDGLELARLADRRAVHVLMQRFDDAGTTVEDRVRMARALGELLGAMEDKRAREHADDQRVRVALVQALASEHRELADEAAIALGRMWDPRSRARLQQLVLAESLDVRVRAALALGRLHDRHATTGLIEALWAPPSPKQREDAIRMLGWLRDTRAVEPLTSLLADKQVRYLVVMALGHIGDPRVAPMLHSILETDGHADTRENAVMALGLMRAAESTATVHRLVVQEPDLRNAPETLVRVGAIERGLVGGADFSPAHRGALQARAECGEEPWFRDWGYRQRTTCTATGGSVRVRARMATGSREHRVREYELIVSARVAAAARDDAERTAPSLVVGIEGKADEVFRGRAVRKSWEHPSLDTRWSDIRWRVPASDLPAAGSWMNIDLTLSTPGVPLQVDHVLVVPVLAALGGSE